MSFLLAVFFRLGVGMRHSMAKAVQLVQGTPKLAASQRTWGGWVSRCGRALRAGNGGNEPFVHGTSVAREVVSQTNDLGAEANAVWASRKRQRTSSVGDLPRKLGRRAAYFAQRGQGRVRTAARADSPAEARVRGGLRAGRLRGRGLGAVGRGGRGHGHEAALLGHGVEEREAARRLSGVQAEGAAEPGERWR